MDRTTLVLEQSLKRLIKDRAKKMNLSMAEFIRFVIKKFIDESPDGKNERDPFFADQAIFSGDVPTDLSVNHDKYLYGDD